MSCYNWSMGWLNKWFDEVDWPKDPRLDAFRDGVWELSLNGESMGWVTTGVVPMRSFPFFWQGGANVDASALARWGARLPGRGLRS
jgi:hypothetical protein